MSFQADIQIPVVPMSALGQKRSFDRYRLNVRFTPQSGHSFEGSPMAAFDPKRTSAVGPRCAILKIESYRSPASLAANAWTPDLASPIFMSWRFEEIPMDDFDPTVSFAVWENAFTPAELDRIEAYGDRLAPLEATVAADEAHDILREDVRVTRTAAILPTAESSWIYDRLQRVTRTLNDRVYKFDISGFSEPFQYSVYHASERGHYDWHVDMGKLKTPRKLSVSVQLTDPSHYEGCDLQFHAGKQIETGVRDRGAVIAFPSYVLHRVTRCTRGTRKALVAWTTGGHFR